MPVAIRLSKNFYDRLGDEAAGGSAGGIAMDWRDGADPRGMLLAKESYA